MKILPSVNVKRVAQHTCMMILLATPIGLLAQPAEQSKNQDHVISAQGMQQQVDSSSANRQKNIATLTNLLSTPEAQKAVRDAHVDMAQVRTAIPTLSDQELKDLSTRATNAQNDFAAGHIGPGLLTIIVLGIIVIIIVSIVH